MVIKYETIVWDSCNTLYHIRNLLSNRKINFDKRTKQGSDH